MLFLVAPHRDSPERHPPRRLTVGQLRYSSDCMATGRAAQTDAKTEVRFGNIVTKQWTLSGFLQHTSVISMIKNHNRTKTSPHLNVLHKNKMLQRVTYQQTSLSVGIQLQSRWRKRRGSTRRAHHCPSINGIFPLVSNIIGKRGSTLTTPKMLMVHSSAK